HLHSATKLIRHHATEKDNAEGDERGPPGQQEHNDHGHYCPQQRCPLTVEPEGGTPTCRSHQGTPKTHHSLNITWKTLGAETRQAKAEDSVAPKIPAVIRGANPDTILILWKEREGRREGEVSRDVGTREDARRRGEEDGEHAKEAAFWPSPAGHKVGSENIGCRHKDKRNGQQAGDSDHADDSYVIDGVHHAGAIFLGVDVGGEDTAPPHTPLITCMSDCTVSAKPTVCMATATALAKAKISPMEPPSSGPKLREIRNHPVGLLIQRWRDSILLWEEVWREIWGGEKGINVTMDLSKGFR
ncbi:hypothetical protein JZ751_029972, partial [Albula glossodonta]